MFLVNIWIGFTTRGIRVGNAIESRIRLRNAFKGKQSFSFEIIAKALIFHEMKTEKF